MRRSILINAILTAAAMTAVVSCGDSSPMSSRVTGPSYAFGKGNAYGAVNGNAGSQLVACSAHDSASASAMIGSDGGTISVGNVHLVIPGNALTDSVLITATIPADTLADVQFGPQGLQFAKDVNLQIGTNGCSLGQSSPSHVDYLDNSGNVLETLTASFNNGNGTVTTKIHHFSSYAIAF